MVFKNSLFKILLSFFFIASAFYLAYLYYHEDKPVITIYAETEECIKVRPKELENTVSSQNHSLVYDLISKKKHTKELRFLPDPEKPIDIAIPKEHAAGNIESLTAKFSQKPDLTNINVAGNKRKGSGVKSNVDKTTLNIVKITKKNSAPILANNYNKYNKGRGYMLQLASVKSETAALQEGERIKKRFSKILANADITAKKVTHGEGRFFYLVLAGNFKTIGEAKSVCKKLLSQQQSCVLK